MQQTKKGSALEVSMSLVTGFIVSMIIYRFVVPPLLGVPYQASQNFLITSIFTAASFIRSFVWRRVFNGWQKEPAKEALAVPMGRRQINSDTFNKLRNGGI